MKGIIFRTMIVVASAFLSRVPLSAQTPSTPSPQSAVEFENYARKLRDTTIRGMAPQTIVPTTAGLPAVSSRYPWKTGIVTTVFWIGGVIHEKESNTANAWDPKWQENYGGFDNPDPKQRHDFIPTAFVPKLNPFYIALPYNDVARNIPKPEARIVIPWFAAAFVEEGQSVCRDRWVAIRNAAGKVCYAQWGDCGPFGSDHWQYVFGNEKPKPNANQGAGLNVSPAVRDYLGLGGTDVTDWKFVEFKDVPQGPWSLHGKNNPFVQGAQRSPEHEQKNEAAPLEPKYVAPAPEESASKETK